MKKCSTCKDFKNESEFGKDKYNKKDGLNYRCKACRKIFTDSHKKEIKEYSKIHYRKNKEENLLKQKIWRKTPNGKKSHKKRTKKWIKNNSEKRTSHWKLYNAIKSGKIIKPNKCSICGKENCIIHGHHNNYEKPLDVVWCCQQCHKNLHQRQL